LSRARHFLFYANNVNLLEENINPIKKNMETLLDAGKKAGLEVNAVETRNKFMFLRQKKIGQNSNI
jgi:hypothetical protein